MALQGSLPYAKYNKVRQIASAYTPTLAASTEEKYESHGNLSVTIEAVSKSEQSFLLDNFNAILDDSTSLPTIIGSFGVGKMNENGQRLLKFCSYYDLVATNSYFRTKSQHRVSWRHPCSKKLHKLDIILTRRFSLKDTQSLYCMSKLKQQAKNF